jgi:hypothetical protein
MMQQKRERDLDALSRVFFKIFIILVILLRFNIPDHKDFQYAILVIFFLSNIILATLSSWLFIITKLKKELVLAIIFLINTIYTAIALL